MQNSWKTLIHGFKDSRTPNEDECKEDLTEAHHKQTDETGRNLERSQGKSHITPRETKIWTMGAFLTEVGESRIIFKE